ncbi:hypothetical protein ACSHWB_03220 [Lentzea sp. HUAS TT2]|uniref:hypothetical protein n=1 Tax=Lentzea sp. HUAS TT2 TaxID=3447454 RepID=UPI003F709EBE
MTDIRPVELPEIRASIIAWLDSPAAAQLWYKATATGSYDWLPGKASTEPSEAGSFLRGAEILRLRDSVLFYVAADMVELVDAAARSVPDFQLAPEDLPADAGLMVFQRPIAPSSLGETQLGITAVCWARVPGRDDVLLGSTYLDRDEAAPVFDRIAPNRQMATTEPRLVYAHGGEFAWPFGDNAETMLDSTNFKVNLLPKLRAAWLLMQQKPLVDISDVQLPRPARRRLLRGGYEPRPVRLLELRRPKVTDSADESAVREHHHRWIVRGHWRQQWYPSRQVHRPVWIAPHLKGPDDAPLVGGEKVNVWKR